MGKYSKAKFSALMLFLALLGCATTPPQNQLCGNGVCESGEQFTCESDCGMPPAGIGNLQNAQSPNTQTPDYVPQNPNNQATGILILEEDGTSFDFAATQIYYTGTFCPSGGGECTVVSEKVPLQIEETNSNGLPEGKYILTIFANGYAAAPAEFVVGEDGTANVTIRMMKE